MASVERDWSSTPPIRQSLFPKLFPTPITATPTGALCARQQAGYQPSGPIRVSGARDGRDREAERDDRHEPRHDDALPDAEARLRGGAEPIPPRGDLGHAANFLYMLSGSDPDPERVRALETYSNTVVDHGLNASTFTARVITSTGSDLVSAVVGAIGALSDASRTAITLYAINSSLIVVLMEALHARIRRLEAALEKAAGDRPPSK